MKIEILETTGKFDKYVCEYPKCDSKGGKLTNKILRITQDYTYRLHICFDCLKKGVYINSEFIERMNLK